MPSNIQKSFAPNSKDVRYLNRDFSTLKNALVTFAQSYYPNTYKDFSPSSPGMMFIEQAAYVGDILSYYTDYAFKEGVMQTASERRNIINLAGYLGYKISPSKASSGNILLYQLCPSANDGNGNYFPDSNYMLSLNNSTQFSSNAGAYYVLNESVNFSLTSSSSPRLDVVYSRNTDGTPQFFLLQKSGSISAGQIVSRNFVVAAATPYYTISLPETNVLEIIDVYDSDNNQWYEVDYMAQDIVPIAQPNSPTYFTSLSEYQDSVPYILTYLRTSRRFITSVDENNITTLQFGAGINGISDEIVTFDSNLIGVGLQNINRLNVPLDPSNFLNDENYGIAPVNTTLTVRYLVGGGLSSNCQANEVINIISPVFDNPTEGLLPEQSDLLTTVQNSLQVTNPDPIVGGADTETSDEIKMNAMANFATQTRVVTKDDYLVRVYSLPSKFGSIAKAQVIPDTNLNVTINGVLPGTINQDNGISVTDTSTNAYFRQIAYNAGKPFAINVYVLSYDENKNLVSPNEALVSNLIAYLKQFQMMTDAINIIDGYVINIGVNFSIVVYNGYNNKDVLLNCIQAVQDFFDIDNWNFSQPINLNQLQLEIAKTDGVQSVSTLQIVNKTAADGDYSPVLYDINAATNNGIIYPSVDPSIFEVKFPNSDIQGSVV